MKEVGVDLEIGMDLTACQRWLPRHLASLEGGLVMCTAECQRLETAARQHIGQGGPVGSGTGLKGGMDKGQMRRTNRVRRGSKPQAAVFGQPQAAVFGQQEEDVYL
eukprot:TRINITY_DN5738_c0_g1_i10.p2 TRINITY_DN5738_c0_g1~~TRINITY_DN5738_c0_g1_i10.p2  ORF type:complete len:106 (-),score=23.06 TRINITY_DN5738_c0_g1_i10:496-813(-)